MFKRIGENAKYTATFGAPLGDFSELLTSRKCMKK